VTYDIITFAPRTYLVWRKKIEIKNITDKAMWQNAFEKVHAYIQKDVRPHARREPWAKYTQR
jgi:hypothetical protein